VLAQDLVATDLGSWLQEPILRSMTAARQKNFS